VTQPPRRLHRSPRFLPVTCRTDAVGVEVDLQITLGLMRLSSATGVRSWIDDAELMALVLPDPRTEFEVGESAGDDDGVAGEPAVADLPVDTADRYGSIA
jgi:hypothetical protein